MKRVAFAIAAAALSLNAQVTPGFGTQTTPGYGAPSPSITSTLSTRPAGLGQLQLDNRVYGGVPEGTATGTPITVNLREAVTRGLARNLAVVSGSADVQEAQSRLTAAIGAFLPIINGRIAETSQQVNLAAFGLPPFPGVPQIVGPFQLFDARASLQQNIVSIPAIQQRRAARSLVNAANLSYQDLKDQVVVAVASLYLQALTATAETTTTQAQLTTAEALFKQASDQKEAGVAIGVDVLRAQVEMQNERQRLILSQANEQHALLNLGRAIGLPAGQAVQVAPLSEDVPSLRTLDDYLRAASQNRSDLKAAAALVKAAEQNRAAVRAEWLPSVVGEANYGTIGPSITSNHGTYAATAAVNIPIFPGNRIKAATEEADAEITRRRASYSSLQRAVDDEVRGAFLDLNSAIQRYQVARDNRELAVQQLEQSRDRFRAGVTNNLEVIQAQQNVTAAEEALISGRYGVQVARLATARAAGNAEEMIREVVK